MVVYTIENKSISNIIRHISYDIIVDSNTQNNTLRQ